MQILYQVMAVVGVCLIFIAVKGARVKIAAFFKKLFRRDGGKG